MIGKQACSFVMFCTAVLTASAVGSGPARADPPSFPLYCQAPIKIRVGHPPNDRTSADNWFTFKWAPTGAGQAPPPPGNCAWADRRPRGVELTGALVVGTGLRPLPVNFDTGPPIFVQLCVFRNQKPNYLRATGPQGIAQPMQNANIHPPFSASPGGCP